MSDVERLARKLGGEWTVEKVAFFGGYYVGILVGIIGGIGIGAAIWAT